MISNVPNRILRPIKFVWAKANDIYLDIETGYSAAINGKQLEQTKHDDARGYQAVDYWNIRRVICALKPGPDDIIYDIGCGKGRVVACFARLRLKRVVGIDLSEALCEAARVNSEHLRGRQTSI